MARFDVYRSEAGLAPYLLDCQADLLRDFDTRFVVPLYHAEGSRQATRLHPMLHVEGTPCLMITQLASAIPARELRNRLGSLADEQAAIMNALDMLITGY